MSLAACGGKPSSPASTLATTQTPGLTQTASSGLFGTQAHTKSTSTPLPAVPATPNASTPSPLGVSADQLKGVQVSLWHPFSGAEAATFQSILDEFNRSNTWGITVKASGYAGFGGLDDAVESTLTSGPLPDVLVDYGYQANQWRASGMLIDLAPYVNDPVWGLTAEQQADFYPTFWSEDSNSAPAQPQYGRTGVPYYRSAYTLFYNQSWAEELGYPQPPATPEDFRVRACAASEAIAGQGAKSKLGTGGWLITSEPGVLAGWIYAFGGTIAKPGGSGYQFDTPEANQALAYLKNLQEGGCAWADNTLNPQAAFAKRQALFVAGSLADISSEAAAFSAAGSADKWLVIPFPSNRQPVVVTYGPSLFVTGSTPERQLASWLVIAWLIYPPNQAELVSSLMAYPTRLSTTGYLNTGSSYPWAQTLALLPAARSEPSLASWGVLRWALADASTQLFSPQFRPDQVPTLLANLDTLAAEVVNQAR